MAYIVTSKSHPREDWLNKLADAITDPLKLLRFLALENDPQLRKGVEAHTLFPLRVPWSFAAKMRKGDPLDPLLLQVLTAQNEFLITPGFSVDPLDEQQSVVPGLLHKYHNRALLLVKGNCAVNCRYCFRRHFPYQDNQGSKSNWRQALDYIRQHPELDEIIFSGGDPLMAKDRELDWLISELENIPHVQRLRIHSRLPVVIPERITETLCKRLSQTHLSVLLVTHINHANEIDKELRESITRLRQAGITLLNQSVLLRGVNDNASTLASLSNTLFNAGILPYYLNMLDKVQGAAHFLVSDEEARDITIKLLSQVSGYLVPRLTREVGGEASKTLLDLQLVKNS
ncbi:MAG: EF-P beta-lysylation protein EpmB [Candidatus Malihini olakiniferum]